MWRLRERNRGSEREKKKEKTRERKSNRNQPGELLKTISPQASHPRILSLFGVEPRYDCIFKASFSQ